MSARDLPVEVKVKLDALFREMQERAVSILREHLAARPGRVVRPALEDGPTDAVTAARARQLLRQHGVAPRKGAPSR